MKRRKQKPIPNAEDVARALTPDEMATGIAWDIDAALERGRKIGKLECIADGLAATLAFPRVVLPPEDRVTIIPVLRAEIARLKGDAK